MKDLYFFRDFINNKKKKIKKLPKIGDNISINFLYLNGLKNFKFFTKTFFGRCIAIKRKNLNTSFLILRNVFNKDPLELSFFLHSPFVIKLIKRKKNRHSKFIRNKLYYLRYKKLAQSKLK